MKKRRWLAAVLNLLWPPFGYFYTGHKRRFFTFLVLPPLLILLTLFAVSRLPPAAISGVLIVVMAAAAALYIGLPVDAFRCARDAGQETLFQRPRAYWSLPLFLVLSVLMELALPALRTFLADARNIPSASMVPTLLPGDYVFVSALRSEPRRGELLAFYPPGEEEKLFIKRLVGLPGDHIEMREEAMLVNGSQISILRLRINGRDIPVKLEGAFSDSCGQDRCFRFTEGEGQEAHHILEGGFQSPAETPALVLGPDEYFLLGDNRDNSRDSRFIGPILRKDLHSRYLYTYASFAPPVCAEFEETIRPECRAAMAESVSIPDTLQRLLHSSPRFERFGIIVH